jgi:hypothetical protein
MNLKLHNCHFKKLARSKYAMALPVTFLILFVSTLSIVAFTYYFSVERINSQGQTLKVSTAKQNLLSLNDAIVSTLWQPGSSSTFDLTDSGGLTNIQPTTNVLTLSINDNSGIQETSFNTSIGKITYQLPYSSSSETGLYLKGDSRTITNQSGSSTSQLCIENGAEHPEIQLHYRPSVTYVAAGLENGKPVNNIRIYIVNLNSSAAIALQGELPLHISCESTQLTTKNYDVPYALENLAITSVLDGVSGSVSIPISSTSEGAVIHIETVVSNVSIQRWIR